MSSIYVRCSGCDFSGIIQRRPINLEYVLPSGSLVAGYRVNAWCTSCENITDAEVVFDAIQIQAEIDSLRRQQGGLFRRFLDPEKTKALDSQLQRLSEKLQLSKIRQSRPRCLRCQEITISPVNFDENGISSVVHECGRKLYKVSDDPNAPRFMYKPVTIRLDPEGRRL